MVKKLTKQYFIENIFDFENNTEFKYKGGLPTLIKMGAMWCGPCKAIEPTLEELSVLYDGKVDIYHFDIEEEAELTDYFKIRSVPSLFFIPSEGEPVMKTGSQSKSQFINLFDTILKVK